MRKVPRALTVALTAALLTACAAYQPRPVDLSRQAVRLQQRRLDDPLLARDAARAGLAHWPPRRWTRGDLLLAALFDSPRIAEARARLRVRQAGEVTAGEYPNPRLTLGGEYALAAGTAGIAPWLYGVLLQVLLPRTDLRHAQQAQAAFYTRAAGWSLAQSLWSLRSRLRRHLLTLNYADAAAAVLTRQAQDTTTLAQSLTAQLQAGESAAPRVQAAQAQALQARQQRDAMRARAAAARQSLAADIGIPVTALPPLRPVWRHWQRLPTVTPARLHALRQRALLSRADLARAVAGYQAAQQALRIEVDRQYPGVHVEPGYTFDHGVQKLPLSLSLALPLFNQNQGPIAQARARRAEAGAHLEAVQARILGEIASARSARRQAAAIARRDRLQQLPLAARQLQAARQQFNAGESPRSALLGARIIDARIRLAALRSAFQAQTAQGALEDALHAPFDRSERALARLLDHPARLEAAR